MVRIDIPDGQDPLMHLRGGTDTAFTEIAQRFAMDHLEMDGACRIPAGVVGGRAAAP